ncbi:hypothetical protein KTN05_01905 [Paracoccus sp. Z118]|uniref:hypothetical protein n=1 Tax=Paracoccus sp. Z118 TaxID=2851017 RepID=UPI001C2CA01C|nr:hypothetical protein [Paracoccus sp. Z118]MBV0890602.1 hypothetical protein [Paracoccus sp. Z118]
MPLPHFLITLAAVILAVGATIWLAVAVGLPFKAVLLGALVGAVVVHLSGAFARSDDGPDHRHDGAH